MLKLELQIKHGIVNRQKMAMIEMLQALGEPLVLGGDGRSDSPGHSAKYGLYTFMDLEHNVILDVELVQVCAIASYWINMV